MNTNTNYIVIYRMDFAMKLIEMGHKVMSTMPNPQKPKYTTWIFEKDDTINQDLMTLKGGNFNGR